MRHLDNNPQELDAWLAEHRSRLLGHYFEVLIAFWLGQWPRVTLLACRLPVQGEGKILGEFDFLFYDRYRGQTMHWECTVKFFLRRQQDDGDYDWLGPNPRDTLMGKYRKVFERQLRLSTLSEAKSVLAERDIELPLPQAFFKGYLFYPADTDWQHPSPIPADSSPRHLRGWWCRADRPALIPAVADGSRWISLERLHWLSPALSRESAPGFERATLLDWLSGHFDGSDRPVLLAELRPGRDGVWREVNRGFVVSRQWPDLPPQG
ncbi:MAG: DUF1853 family protein [Candidatus Thiodiazotropha sp.]